MVKVLGESDVVSRIKSLNQKQQILHMNEINTEGYLLQKGIAYRENGNELITKCLFNSCDNDSAGNEAHLYFSKETGQYDCKKCGEKGNLITLQKHFGDQTTPQRASLYKGSRFSEELVYKCHENLPERIRTYLNNRGIIDGVIDSYHLGYGNFYGKNYITIPIIDESGYVFFKLRQDPKDGDGKITYPKGAEAQLFGLYAPQGEKQIFCEGELDALALISQGCFALTSTHGSGTFKDEWVDDTDIKKSGKIYVCYDNDTAGRNGALKVLKALKKVGLRNIYNITLPEEVGDGGDITDYLTKLKMPVSSLFNTHSKEYPERIDWSQFEPLTPDALSEALELTIKKDNENKVVTFLCQLSAYTEDAQFNVSFNSPSSTGKSFIALEVSKLFPNDDVIKLGNCSKTAFFHEQGSYDKETNIITVDLSRKILIFTDMPHTGLLEGLRSFLSHDEKVMYSKITDKNQKGGNRTKTVALNGYPAVIFCTAGLKMDPQEMTRFILLSPEVNQEKMRAGISSTILKEADNDKYKEILDNNPARKLLKLRIEAIRNEHIGEIKIENYGEIERRFMKNDRVLQPRHMRDVKRLISLIKSFALLNMWWRDREGDTITANDNDIEQAFELWDRISVSQELNIPPYVYELYTKVFIPAYEEKNETCFGEFDTKTGITRAEIMQKHYQVYKRRMNMSSLRFDILPTLESAGLITREKDKEDGRKEVIFITEFTDTGELENNSVGASGVNETSTENNSATGSGVKTLLDDDIDI